MKLNYGMVSVAALALGLGACSKTVPIETTIQKVEEPAPIINTKDVLYKNLSNILKADVVEMNLTSKNVKIFMHSKNKKVNIKSLN